MLTRYRFLYNTALHRKLLRRDCTMYKYIATLFFIYISPHSYCSTMSEVFTVSYKSGREITKETNFSRKYPQKEMEHRSVIPGADKYTCHF